MQLAKNNGVNERCTFFSNKWKIWEKTYFEQFILQSHLHPGRAPVDVRGDPGTTGINRSTSVTMPATSGMIRVHQAFDPGWNKILNITGVVWGDPGSVA
jgi:hypothetical protein